jgi:hypothetical protein
VRRRPPVDPQAARRFAFQTLAALAAERDSNAQYIHEAATAAHDDMGLTYAEIARALGLASSGAAWHIANDSEPDEEAG